MKDIPTLFFIKTYTTSNILTLYIIFGRPDPLYFCVILYYYHMYEI